MKGKIVILSLLLVALYSCLKDNGVYVYEREIEPALADGETGLTVYCYGGDTARAVVKFETLGRDSLESDWTYEWKLWDSVICEDKDLVMLSDDIFEKIKITSFPADQAVSGIFSMRNIRTGAVYQFPVAFYMRPKYWNGQWLILSEDGADSKLSYLQTKVDNETQQVAYELTEDIYQMINGEPLLGKPVRLFTHMAPNISTSVGATFVVTEKSMLELSNETFRQAAGIEDLFLDGAPAGFQAKDLICLDYYNYMIDQEGRVYKRTFTSNYLGGKYINEPYQIDDKDMRVAFWGEGPVYPTADFLPAWDEKNGRIVMISNSRTQNIYAVRDETEKDFMVSNMPEGTRVLYLLFKEAIWNDETWMYDGYSYNMIYNDVGGKTWLGEFVVGKDMDEKPLCTSVTVAPFPGGDVEENTLFIGTSSYSGPNARIFYAKGNEIRYVERYAQVDRSYMTFQHEITSLAFAAYADWMSGLEPYKQIAVGFENGDFMLLDISNPDRPQIIEGATRNVGGKVVSVAQIGVNTHVIEN